MLLTKVVHDSKITFNNKMKHYIIYFINEHCLKESNERVRIC